MIENRNGFIWSLHKKSWTVSNVCTNILTTIQMTVLQVCLFFYLNLSIYHDLIYYLCAFHKCSPVVEHVCLRQVAVTIWHPPKTFYYFPTSRFTDQRTAGLCSKAGLTDIIGNSVQARGTTPWEWTWNLIQKNCIQGLDIRHGLLNIWTELLTVTMNKLLCLKNEGA